MNIVFGAKAALPPPKMKIMMTIIQNSGVER